MDRVSDVEKGLDGISLTFKLIGAVLGTLLGGAITVGMFVWVSFASDRRMFITSQAADRTFMMDMSKQLALTQKDFTNFAAIGPRYSQDMAEKDMLRLKSEIQEWVRMNYPPKATTDTLSDHEKRLQELERRNGNNTSSP
jgi:hypothetical protein